MKTQKKQKTSLIATCGQTFVRQNFRTLKVVDLFSAPALKTQDQCLDFATSYRIA
jgi:hypothetical protein